MERKPNRTKQVVIRLTVAEHQNIVKASKLASRTVSDWCRLVMSECAIHELSKIHDPDDRDMLRKRIIDRMFNDGS
jgi:hypothetical protein